MKDAHKEVEDMMNGMIKEDSAKLLIDFEKWLAKEREKLPSLILDYYTIAEYCLMKENKRPRRADVLSIKSERKEVK